MTLRDHLRRLACRCFDLVTVEQLREATAAVDARWAGEQIGNQARLVELERRLREAMTLPRAADPPSLAARLASGDWVVLEPQGEGGAPLCGAAFKAHPDCPEPCPADCSLAIGAATGICGVEGEGEAPQAPRPPLEIECPECYAPPGAQCLGLDGEPVEWAHQIRIEAAKGRQ